MRVAAYCRVSSDETGQLGSLATQKEFFDRYIAGREGWKLVGVFADEGRSGTSVNKRGQFLRLMKAAEDGEVDLIITKDVSRFARNTLDTLMHTRALKARGVGVIFINDNINTLENEGEFRLTIMAGVAQEESRKTSERIKWGQKRRMESGVVFGNNSLLGYDISGGRLTVNETEAAIVRLIFKKYVFEKKGCHTIAMELDKEGVRPRFAAAWTQQSVMKVLKNEKYTGDLVQGKSFTPDYLDHRKIKNSDRDTYITIKNNHTPIISRRMFERAADIMRQRSKYNKK